MIWLALFCYVVWPFVCRVYYIYIYNDAILLDKVLGMKIINDKIGNISKWHGIQIIPKWLPLGPVIWIMVLFEIVFTNIYKSARKALEFLHQNENRTASVVKGILILLAMPFLVVLLVVGKLFIYISFVKTDANIIINNHI